MIKRSHYADFSTIPAAGNVSKKTHNGYIGAHMECVVCASIETGVVKNVSWETTQIPCQNGGGCRGAPVRKNSEKKKVCLERGQVRWY